MISDIDLINRVKVENDSAALSELVHRHSGIYIKIVQKYANIERNAPYPSAKIDINELRDDKMLNLYQFAQTYDPTRGTKFSTFVGQQTRYLCLNILNDTPRKVDLDEGAPAISSVEPVRATESVDDIKRYAPTIRSPLFWPIFELRHLRDKPATWRAIGQQVGVTHEWARQIYHQHIDKVRAYITT